MNELLELRDKYREEKYCELLGESLYREHYGEAHSHEDDRLLAEEYEDGPRSVSYASYVASEVMKLLVANSRCMVTLSNSSGEDKTMVHVFTLYLVDSSIYRLESYGTHAYDIVGDRIARVDMSLYEPRIVEWPTMQYDLTKLVSMRAGSDRVAYWNGLFSSRELEDTEFEMDVILSA
ncbi:Hypothetical protein POVR2_LOCUS75 [uncultured virus]|nr:Hypothetical protein POVR2_LOCUS75 [uncultured virus]